MPKPKTRAAEKDAITQLKEDHKKIRVLLGELEETSTRAVDEREELLQTIEHGAPVNAVAFALTGGDLVSGAIDGSVIVLRENGTRIELAIFAQESRRPTMRWKTGLPGFESTGSAKKYPWRSNW